MSKKLSNIREKIRHGSPPSDEELRYLIDKCKPVLSVLAECGETYHLAWNALRQEVEFAIECRQMRKLHGVKYTEVDGKVVPTRKQRK